jgi:hypothetical protein
VKVSSSYHHSHTYNYNESLFSVCIPLLCYESTNQTAKVANRKHSPASVGYRTEKTVPTCMSQKNKKHPSTTIMNMWWPLPTKKGKGKHTFQTPIGYAGYPQHTNAMQCNVVMIVIVFIQGSTPLPQKRRCRSGLARRWQRRQPSTRQCW